MYTWFCWFICFCSSCFPSHPGLPMLQLLPSPLFFCVFPTPVLCSPHLCTPPTHILLPSACHHACSPTVSQIHLGPCFPTCMPLPLDTCHHLLPYPLPVVCLLPRPCVPVFSQDLGCSAAFTLGLHCLEEFPCLFPPCPLPHHPTLPHLLGRFLPAGPSSPACPLPPCPPTLLPFALPDSQEDRDLEFPFPPFLVEGCPVPGGGGEGVLVFRCYPACPGQLLPWLVVYPCLPDTGGEMTFPRAYPIPHPFLPGGDGSGPATFVLWTPLPSHVSPPHMTPFPLPYVLCPQTYSQERNETFPSPHLPPYLAHYLLLPATCLLPLGRDLWGSAVPCHLPTVPVMPLLLWTFWPSHGYNYFIATQTAFLLPSLYVQYYSFNPSSAVLCYCIPAGFLSLCRATYIL